MIAEVAVVVVSLRILVDWPAHAAEVAAAATALVPLALAAGTSTRIARRVDRVLVHTVSATGLTAVVVLVYLVIVIGLGRARLQRAHPAGALDAGRRRGRARLRPRP